MNFTYKYHNIMNITVLLNGGVVSFSSANCNLFQWTASTLTTYTESDKNHQPLYGNGNWYSSACRV